MTETLETILLLYMLSVLIMGAGVMYLAPGNERLQSALTKMSPLRGALLMTLIIALWPVMMIWVAVTEDEADD